MKTEKKREMKPEELADGVEEDGEEIITPMPATCPTWKCDGAKLVINEVGYWVCPNCGGSYGYAVES